MKLVDVDSACEMGAACPGNAPPWARLQGSEAGIAAGTWGNYGVRTEQFAIGSILYAASRGREPYELGNEEQDVVTMLQRVHFPEPSEGDLDKIIYRCWQGDFHTIQELVDKTARLSGTDGAENMQAFDSERLSKLEERCKNIYASF